MDPYKKSYHVVVEARGKRYGTMVVATNMRIAIDSGIHDAWRHWSDDKVRKFEIECVWAERTNFDRHSFETMQEQVTNYAPF